MSLSRFDDAVPYGFGAADDEVVGDVKLSNEGRMRECASSPEEAKPRRRGDKVEAEPPLELVIVPARGFAVNEGEKKNMSHTYKLEKEKTSI